MDEDEEIKEYECELCNDTGFIPEMEQVYPGEPHMADIGERPCICQARDDSDDSRD